MSSGSEQGNEHGRRRASELGMELAWWARHSPGVPAVVTGFTRRSFRELNANANRLARVLLGSGVRAGDVVGLVCGSRPELVEVVHACRRIGVGCAVLPSLLARDELDYLVRDSGARALIVDSRLGTRLKDLGAQTHAPAVCVRLAIGGDLPGFDAYEHALAGCCASDLERPERGCLITYTSGPIRLVGVVPVQRTPPNASVALRAARYQAGRGHVALCPYPLAHARVLELSLLGPLDAGVTVVLTEDRSPKALLALIEQYRVTHLHLAGTDLMRLSSLPSVVRRRYQLSSLRHVIHGMQRCTAESKRAAIAWLGPIIWEYYGGVELVGTLIDSPEWLRAPSTLGRPELPDGVLVRDDCGVDCAPGVDGQICIALDAHTAFEYHRHPELTQAVIFDGYFRTGDVGHLDADGRLVLVEPLANAILTRSFHPPVYGIEVENELCQHPAVEDVAVIGVAGEYRTELAAVIAVSSRQLGKALHDLSDLEELDPGWEEANALKSELLAWCRRRLAPHKCPTRIHLVARFPRSAVGRIERRRVRERFALSRPRSA